MKRKVVSLFIISLPLLLVTVFWQAPVTAAPVQQTIPVEDPATPLAQPQQIVILQQIPLVFTVAMTTPMTDSTSSNLIGALISSINQGEAVTPTLMTQTVAVTLTLDLQLTVTDTLTTTVPSTVTLTWGNQQTTTMPISITVGTLPAAAVRITLLASPALTATTAITPSAAVSLTAGSEITPTAVITQSPISTDTAITGTLAFTVNLRSGPDTTFDTAGTLPGNQVVTVVAQNADGTWYLLNNGLWVAAFLVENVQGELPLATDELAATLRAQVPVTPTITSTLTATNAVTSTVTPTATGPILVPTPAAATQPSATQPGATPSVTVNANLRAGPATTFDIVGGTVAGQEITIIGRNAEGTWFQLDNDGWVSVSLVANPPATDSVPISSAEGSAEGSATATPTPSPTLVPTSTAPILGVRENLYIIRVDGLVDSYDLTLDTIDGLVTRASANEALLKDPTWISEMTAAIALLRATGDEATALSAPALFAAPQVDLVQAATAFTRAAELLAEGIDQLDTDQLDAAFAQITSGTASLTQVQNGIAELTP